ncbi:alpha/beta fold hydrolase [Streptomyces sp. WMMB303]|uniref:alpha/beta fold hydrolase n=1 Tax=unclassified Streptomyces TaxID=2593676 RepID=UPI0023ED4CF7|nr:alpha/beta hydrolase [Streptomyces sp. WMMB303]MDF4250399.1 alpha/beta hydrolase [Streptomyces sp. WMMB303]
MRAQEQDGSTAAAPAHGTHTAPDGGPASGPGVRGRTSREAATGAALNATAVLSPALAGRAAFALFRSPLGRARVLPGESAVHAQAVAEELQVDGERVVTYRWGEGSRPVLLLHGWQSRASRFAAHVPRLRSLGLTPVSFDAPGHGDSGGRTTTILRNVEIAARLQERYGTFDAVLAHSFGVTCALLALRGDITARRLVAVAGVGEFGFLADRFTELLGLRPQLWTALRRRIETDLFPHVPDPWARFDGAHWPAQIDTPMLLINDENDRMVPLRQAHRLLAAHGPRAELVVTRGLGHRAVLGAPRVVDAALDFVQG